MLAVRPKVAELVFQLYGRNLHPELFDVHANRIVERGDYAAAVNVTSAGHRITWRYKGLTLTEVCTSAHHELPLKRRLISHKLDGDRSDDMTCGCGARYETQFQLETVEP